LMTAMSYNPDDGGNKHLWDVGQLLRYYKAQYSRRLSSSYSPPWEPEISILILSSHLSLVIPSFHYTSGFPTKIVHAFLIIDIIKEYLIWKVSAVVSAFYTFFLLKIKL
jgi:hypothetical protein